MILVPLIYVKENDILAKSLIDRDHQILLKKGMPIKKSQIKKLMELGYNNLYIASKIDYEPEEYIRSTDRDALMQKMKKIYIKMKKACEMDRKNKANRSASVMIQLDDEKIKEIKGINSDVEELVGNIYTSKKDYLDYVTVKNYANYPFNHAIDTGILSTLIGRKLGMNARDLIDLFMAAVVSELSNACLPEHILNKKGKLDSSEFELVKQHPENGYRTAKSCPFLGHNVKMICLKHHERVDGNGYPNNLSGDEIDVKAKILAVADVYDSLTSGRTYRPPYPPHKALAIIRSEVNKAYDEEIYNILKDIVVPYPIGTIVKLDTQQVGLVVGIHRDKPERPVIITSDASKPRKIDLREESSLNIVALKYDNIR